MTVHGTGGGGPRPGAPSRLRALLGTGARRRIGALVATGSVRGEALRRRAGTLHRIEALRRLEALLLRRTRPTAALATTLLAAASGLSLVVAAALVSPAPVSDPPAWVPGGPSPTPAESPGPPVRQALRSVATAPAPSPTRPPPPPFTAWAIMDMRTGAVDGSVNLARTSTTASMIKAWLVADYLRRTGDPSQRLDELSAIIRDSNNEHTHELFLDLGQEESIHRLIDICGLTDSHAVPGYWSNTALSPRDTARMGACLADGRAAGDEWTDWVLEEMRLVRGLGDFGIRHAFPADQRSAIAIKNGWVVRHESGEYHVNCLAIGDTWTMGVMTRYPARLGYQHGAEICRSLAAEHLVPQVR